MSRIDIFTEQQKAIIAKDAPAWLEGMGVQPVAKVPEFILDTENAVLEDDKLMIWVVSLPGKKRLHQIGIPIDHSGTPDLSSIDQSSVEIVDSLKGTFFTVGKETLVSTVAESLKEQARYYVGWLVDGYRHMANTFWKESQKELAKLEAEVTKLLEQAKEFESQLEKSKDIEPRYYYKPEDGAIYGIIMGLGKAFVDVPKGLWESFPKIAKGLNSLQGRVYSSMEKHDMEKFREAMGIVKDAFLSISWEVIKLVAEDVIFSAPVMWLKVVADRLPKAYKWSKWAVRMAYKVPDKIDDYWGPVNWARGKWQVYDQYRGEVVKTKKEVKEMSQNFMKYRGIAERIKKDVKGESDSE